MQARAPAPGILALSIGIALAAAAAILLFSGREKKASGPRFPPVTSVFEIRAAAPGLRLSELAIMDRLARTYGSDGWFAAAGSLLSRPGDTDNPNTMFIPLSFGNVYLDRYHSGNDPSDLERSIRFFESAAASYPAWGHRWLGAPVVSYLDISLVRLRRECPPPSKRARTEAVWRSALAITEAEADERLARLPLSAFMTRP